MLEVDAEKFKNILKKADKVCGTLEPSNRKVLFFVEENEIYVMASDGCLTGFFELSPIYLPKPFPAFEAPLDVVKQFLSELYGKVIFSYQNGILSLKCQTEILQLKVGYVQPQNGEELHLPKKEYENGEDIVRISKKKFLAELDLVSGYLEEGNYIDIFYSGNYFELLSQHSGIVSYARIKSNLTKESDASFLSESISIPFVSARHMIKTMEMEETEDLKILFQESEKGMHIIGESFYTIRGDTPSESPERIRQLCAKASPDCRILTNQLQKVLRRALLAGRFSDIEIYTRSDQIVVVSRYSSIAYKGTLEVECKNDFSIKTKAYLLRSAINRLGSQNLIISVVDKFVIIASPSLTRFLILGNKRVQ
ncbi:MAG TPA: hypothetical protein PKI14_07755 [Fervidobacterium sp.]|nr:hypothetical protein [Fervidobacterium sp.]HOK87859.1 hypothetical protein [Fervidobacterium sp.]HOM74417.1 hypothetical protein [Fervidobacterium sp.]HOQ39713.1 hypothetical protein [Fervidobacterium sp.]HPP18240.1 hypothetical protein [Fervidobacterium sp.]